MIIIINLCNVFFYKIVWDIDLTLLSCFWLYLNLKNITLTFPSFNIGLTSFHILLFVNITVSILEVMTVRGYNGLSSFKTTKTFHKIYCKLNTLMYACFIKKNEIFHKTLKYYTCFPAKKCYIKKWIKMLLLPLWVGTLQLTLGITFLSRLKTLNNIKEISRKFAYFKLMQKTWEQKKNDTFIN